MPALADHCEVFAVDLPGHGNSTLDGAFDLQPVVDTLAKALPERANWLGWSLGGTLAMELAARYPRQVSQLVLVTATPRFVRTDNWPCGMEPQVLEQFCESLATDYAATVKRFLCPARFVVRSTMPRGPSKSRPVVVEERYDVER